MGKHVWLRALGADDMPSRIELHDGAYVHRRTFKHDFFAATGLYEGPSGLVVLKLGRVARLFGLPMVWMGRLLADREFAVYRLVDDLPGVPTCLGRWGRTGFVHAFVKGHPLQPKERVGDDFFDQLGGLIAELHRRGIAYVDLEKRENILVDDAGRPCLIDFQISWRYRPDDPGGGGYLSRLMPAGLGAFVLRKLQQSDIYHLGKHRRRHRPDTMTPEQIEASYDRGFLGNLHRGLFRPVTLARRAILKKLTGRSRSAKQEGPEFL